MSAPRLSRDELDHITRLHREGETSKSIAQQLGCSESAIYRALKILGLRAHGVRIDLPSGKLLKLFNDGWSTNRLAKRFNVSRNVVDRHLRHAGVTPRTQSEAEALKWSLMTDKQRAHQVKKAHEAMRGRKVSAEEQTAVAAGRAARHAFDSRHEKRLHDTLTERGLNPIVQHAVGPYVCDLAIGAVAVECFAGQWHWAGRHLARLEPRVNYLFDAGYHVIAVHTSTSKPFGGGCADYIVAFLEVTRRYPTAARQYRVIRGDGEVVAAARSDRDDRSLVPSFRVTNDALGRYQSSVENAAWMRWDDHVFYAVDAS